MIGVDVEPRQRPPRGPQSRSWVEVDPRVVRQVADAVQANLWPLTMIGPPGCGKTSIAWLLYDGCRGKRMYREVPELCRKLIDLEQRGDQWGNTPRGFWNDWERCELAILDEIGAREKVSDFHYETVKRAIDLRLDQPLVLISNLTLSKIARLYDDRIASRMAAGIVIEIDGEDRRLRER